MGFRLCIKDFEPQGLQIERERLVTSYFLVLIEYQSGHDTITIYVVFNTTFPKRDKMFQNAKSIKNLL